MPHIILENTYWADKNAREFPSSHSAKHHGGPRQSQVYAMQLPFKGCDDDSINQNQGDRIPAGRPVILDVRALFTTGQFYVQVGRCEDIDRIEIVGLGRWFTVNRDGSISPASFGLLAALQTALRACCAHCVGERMPSMCPGLHSCMECGSKIDLVGLASHKIDAQIAASAGRLSADELSKMIRRIRDIPAQLASRPTALLLPSLAARRERVSIGNAVRRNTEPSSAHRPAEARSRSAPSTAMVSVHKSSTYVSCTYVSSTYVGRFHFV